MKALKDVLTCCALLVGIYAMIVASLPTGDLDRANAIGYEQGFDAAYADKGNPFETPTKYREAITDSDFECKKLYVIAD